MLDDKRGSLVNDANMPHLTHGVSFVGRMVPQTLRLFWFAFEVLVVPGQLELSYLNHIYVIVLSPIASEELVCA